MKEETKEILAAYAHEAWSGWMRYMFSKSQKDDAGNMIIPASLVERWTRQMTTVYAELPESEKKSDRKEADEILGLISLCNQ